MAVDFKIIGKRIQSRRKSLHKTQEEMAEHLNVSVGYVSNMERGVTKISLNTLSNIADYLDCDISELVSQTSDGSKNYIKSELNDVLECLSNSEKNILLSLLKTYLDRNRLEP